MGVKPRPRAHGVFGVWRGGCHWGGLSHGADRDASPTRRQGRLFEDVPHEVRLVVRQSGLDRPSACLEGQARIGGRDDSALLLGVELPGTAKEIDPASLNFTPCSVSRTSSRRRLARR